MFFFLIYYVTFCHLCAGLFLRFSEQLPVPACPPPGPAGTRPPARVCHRGPRAPADERPGPPHGRAGPGRRSGLVLCDGGPGGRQGRPSQLEQGPAGGLPQEDQHCGQGHRGAGHRGGDVGGHRVSGQAAEEDHPLLLRPTAYSTHPPTTIFSMCKNICA